MALGHVSSEEDRNQLETQSTLKVRKEASEVELTISEHREALN